MTDIPSIIQDPRSIAFPAFKASEVSQVIERGDELIPACCEQWCCRYRPVVKSKTEGYLCRAHYNESLAKARSSTT